MIAAIEAMTGLSTLWARIAATGGLVALVLSAWFAFALHYENKGAAKAVAKIEQRTQAKTSKNITNLSLTQQNFTKLPKPLNQN